MQNGDIQIPAHPDCAGKWPLDKCSFVCSFLAYTTALTLLTIAISKGVNPTGRGRRPPKFGVGLEYAKLDGPQSLCAGCVRLVSVLTTNI